MKSYLLYASVMIASVILGLIMANLR